MEVSTAADRLGSMREQLVSRSLAAYVIPTDDPHQSEYVAPAFDRREYLSGFTGSAGTALVTVNEALLWTDGRYFAQAANELDPEYWTLMKDRLPETVSIEDWLCKTLKSGDRVGVDPYVLGNDVAKVWRDKMSKVGVCLVMVEDNLVDLVWGQDRPPLPTEPVFHHPLQFSGCSVREKIDMCRGELHAAAATCLVLSALDEVAWTLNVRGSDIPFNPVVISYVVVHAVSGAVHWYIDEGKVPHQVLKAVNEEAAPYKVTLRPYGALLADVRLAVDSGGTRVLLPTTSSLALHEAVPEPQKIAKRSPVSLWKAVKNPAELEGMRQAHLRDAVALINYFVYLEEVLKVSKTLITEAAGANKLLQFRQELKDFVCPSFATISSSGANGAIIHYKPPEVGSKGISIDEMYLLDSGGQFRDGTTDVTRTMHLGTPTDHERRCFTHVLQSHIALDTCVFPAGITGYQLDAVVRGPMWKAGLDYRHGTGHGVGAFLNVHEGPHGMSLMRKSCDEFGLQSGMTLSNEPGYYEEGGFGIRHENILVVRKVDTPNQFGGVQYLGFEHITFVPFQKSMLVVPLMSPSEIEWVNNYHQECLEKVSPLLVGNESALEWLTAATAPIEIN